MLGLEGEWASSGDGGCIWGQGAGNGFSFTGNSVGVPYIYYPKMSEFEVPKTECNAVLPSSSSLPRQSSKGKRLRKPSLPWRLDPESTHSIVDDPGRLLQSRAFGGRMVNLVVRPLQASSSWGSVNGTKVANRILSTESAFPFSTCHRRRRRPPLPLVIHLRVVPGGDITPIGQPPKPPVTGSKAARRQRVAGLVERRQTERVVAVVHAGLEARHARRVGPRRGRPHVPVGAGHGRILPVACLVEVRSVDLS